MRNRQLKKYKENIGKSYILLNNTFKKVRRIKTHNEFLLRKGYSAQCSLYIYNSKAIEKHKETIKALRKKIARLRKKTEALIKKDTMLSRSTKWQKKQKP